MIVLICKVKGLYPIEVNDFNKIKAMKIYKQMGLMSKFKSQNITIDDLEIKAVEVWKSKKWKNIATIY